MVVAVESPGVPRQEGPHAARDEVGPVLVVAEDRPPFDSLHQDMVQGAGRRFRTKCGSAFSPGPLGMAGSVSESGQSRDVPLDREERIESIKMQRSITRMTRTSEWQTPGV